MKGYERSHPNTTIVLFEPDHRDPEMFLANTFSYRQRRALAEHAYQQTRKMLRERRAVMSAQLAPHGVTIQQEVLDDLGRTLVSHQRAQASVRNRSGRAMHKLEQTLNDLEQTIRANQIPTA